MWGFTGMEWISHMKFSSYIPNITGSSNVSAGVQVERPEDRHENITLSVECPCRHNHLSWAIIPFKNLLIVSAVYSLKHSSSLILWGRFSNEKLVIFQINAPFWVNKILTWFSNTVSTTIELLVVAAILLLEEAGHNNNYIAGSWHVVTPKIWCVYLHFKLHCAGNYFVILAEYKIQITYISIRGWY